MLKILGNLNSLKQIFLYFYRTRHSHKLNVILVGGFRKIMLKLINTLTQYYFPIAMKMTQL